ncbi:MAG: DNA repair protein RadC [Planctomycetota bacterium]|nr:DNA repair protein RadC [Planctomycetota bacterium]MDE1888966.1 DNA repair protein RadC [Planctomycetota bacterium]MDE2215930.1 DNA repair protein RadC [Planctomycetota bacterium]
MKEAKKRPTIKQLPTHERPRERLIQSGDEYLTDAELLGIIIRDGTTNYSAVDLAQELLSKYGDFRKLSSVSIGELCKVRGIGPARAAQIKASLAIAKRFSTISVKPSQQFKCSRDIFNHFHERLRERKQEVFFIVLLDNKNRIIKELDISKGSLTSSIVHPREVFNPAIKESAVSVIFVHNHPSGDPEPSKEDIQMTRRLLEVGDVVGIKVLDHIIIGNECFVSLKDKGIIS